MCVVCVMRESGERTREKERKERERRERGEGREDTGGERRVCGLHPNQSILEWLRGEGREGRSERRGECYQEREVM